MSGDFGEDFKPSAKGADLGREDSSEKHDPFRDERALKAPDTARSEEKAEHQKAPETLAAGAEKAIFKEGSGKDYSDWLAENRTPQENAAALEKSLLAAVEKMAKLTQAGIAADVVAGGNYLANLVNDSSGDEVRKFMASVKNYIEK